MKSVNVYTDGACSGNPGIGGLGAILEYEGKEREIALAYPDTTNNRMELLAAILALEALKEACAVTLYSDSKYLCDSITKGWVNSWKQNSWKKADKKPALNVDLWERMLLQLSRHDVKIVWVKGHNGHPQNERCDRLAVGAIEKFRENQNGTKA